MSYELGTPSTLFSALLIGFTQLMQQDKSLSINHQGYIEIINQSGE
jgi:hypothetical protein